MKRKEIARRRFKAIQNLEPAFKKDDSSDSERSFSPLPKVIEAPAKPNKVPVPVDAAQAAIDALPTEKKHEEN